MPTTREKLIDWLADLPDNTEIGIEDEDLIAIINTKAHFFALSDEALQLNLEAFIGRRDDMVARLQQIPSSRDFIKAASCNLKGWQQVPVVLFRLGEEKIRSMGQPLLDSIRE